MRKSIAAINLRLDDMQKQLNKIEKRGTIDSGRDKVINNEPDFSRTHNLPIHDEEGLRIFNNKLLDTAIFKSMVSGVWV